MLNLWQQQKWFHICEMKYKFYLTLLNFFFLFNFLLKTLKTQERNWYLELKRNLHHFYFCKNLDSLKRQVYLDKTGRNSILKVANWKQVKLFCIKKTGYTRVLFPKPSLSNRGWCACVVWVLLWRSAQTNIPSLLP